MVNEIAVDLRPDGIYVTLWRRRKWACVQHVGKLETKSAHATTEICLCGICYRGFGRTIVPCNSTALRLIRPYRYDIGEKITNNTFTLDA